MRMKCQPQPSRRELARSVGCSGACRHADAMANEAGHLGTNGWLDLDLIGRVVLTLRAAALTPQLWAIYFAQLQEATSLALCHEASLLSTVFSSATLFERA